MTKEINKRTLQAKETKQKLLKTSLELVNKHGYDNVTVDDICDACGVSKGTFYHHFKSKSELISYVDESFKTALTENILDEEDIDIETELILCVNSALDWVEKSGFELTRQRTVLMVSGHYHHYNWDNPFSAFLSSLLKDIIKKAIANGQLKQTTPIDMLTELISVFVTGLIAKWTILEGDFSLTDKSTNLSLPMIKGILREYKL